MSAIGPPLDTDPTATLQQALAAFPDALERIYRSVPADRTNWRPDSWDGIPSERLSAIEQVCHVRDIEGEGYHARIRRTLAEHRPELPDIPGEALAAERHYARLDADAVFADFRQLRAATLSLIRSLSDEDLERVAIFEGAPVTLRGLLHFLCSHDAQHVAGLQWLLAKMHSGSAAGAQR